MKKDKLLYWRVRCNDLEKQAVKNIAKKEGLTPPDALRYIVREFAKSRGEWSAIVEPNKNDEV